MNPGCCREDHCSENIRHKTEIEQIKQLLIAHAWPWSKRLSCHVPKQIQYVATTQQAVGKVRFGKR